MTSFTRGIPATEALPVTELGQCTVEALTQGASLGYPGDAGSLEVQFTVYDALQLFFRPKVAIENKWTAHSEPPVPTAARVTFDVEGRLPPSVHAH